MSISSLGGAGSYLGALTASTSTSTVAVSAHRMLPQDPLNTYLTDSDRARIKATTGADYKPSGGILYPMSMSLDDRVTLSQTVGQVAADRANGTLGGDLSADHLSTLFAQYGYHGAGAPGAGGQDRNTGVDLLA